MNQPRPNIQELAAYVPGEQPGFRDTDAGLLGGGGIVKLNTNENPFPPSPKVLQAIRELPAEALRLYPPADASLFRQTAADLHGLSPQNVIATNGGDELLRLLITVFCSPNPEPSRGGIGMTDPSYTLYSVLAKIQDTPVTVVRRADDGFPLPDDFAEQLNAVDCELAFLVNPHAPTGLFESIDRVRDIAKRFNGLLVVDEAYVDFAPNDALPLVRDGLNNVIILRSLSKGYGLAGLRFGYGLAHPDIIAALDKARDSYNTDILSQAAAVAALRDRPYFQECRDSVIAQRDALAEQLRQRGFTVPKSATNFLLATVPAGQFAESIYQQLKAQNILIRYFNKPRLTDKVRITVGTPEQNNTLLQTLDTLFK